MCHSDVSVIDGTIPFPTPVVLGHEGAGIVERGRATVSASVAVGDHVVLSTLGNCGACAACDSGKPDPLPHVVRQAVGGRSPGRTTQDVPVRRTPACSAEYDRREGPPGRADRARTCRSSVGVAHRLRRASPASARCSTGPRSSHGQSALVIGVGGIGLNVIQGLALVDALPIIAVDTNPTKEELARAVRRHPLHRRRRGRHRRGREGDLPERRRLRLRVRRPPRPHPPVDRPARLGRHRRDPRRAQARHRGQLRGAAACTTTRRSWAAATAPAVRTTTSRCFVDLYLAGRLKLDELVTKTYPIDDIQQTLDDMHARRRSPAACSQIG